MSTAEKTSAIDPRADADAREVLRLVSVGKRATDPEPRRRIREGAARVRRGIREKHGRLDIAVSLIRDVRVE